MAEGMLESLMAEGGQVEDNRLVPYVQALQRWKVWRDNVPLFYSTCVQSTMAWPSCSVQLYPHVRTQDVAPGLLRHAVLYGTQQNDSDEPVLVLASVAVDDPGRQAQLTARTLRWTAPSVDVCSFPHPAGDVDRIRYCPAAPTLIAVKCSGAALSLYDIGPALALLNRGSGGDGDEPGGLGEEDGGGVGGGEQGADGAGAGPVSVLETSAQEGVSMAWGDSGAGGGGGGGSGGGSLRLFSGLLGGSIGEYAVREDGTLAEVTVRRGGHDGDATVVDLAWGGSLEREQGAAEAAEAGPSSAAAATAPGLLASAGTDGRTVLWDPRQRLPALQAPRCRQDVNAVAFAPAASHSGAATAGAGAGAGGGPLLANAGNDGIIRVYDVRQLGGAGATAAAAASASGTSAALYRLKGHNCVVLQLSYSPHNRSLLGAADEQGRVLLWEVGRTSPLEEGLSTRPELLFAHVGHLLPVDDFSWSTELYGTMASVCGALSPGVVEAAREYPDAERDLPCPAASVQVWRPAADLLPATAPAAAPAAGRGPRRRTAGGAAAAAATSARQRGK